MVDEVELDLRGQVAAGHRARRDPVRGDVERDVPPVVAERHERHAHLADDLREAVQRLLRRLPVRVGQGRPGLCHLPHRLR